MKIEINGTCNIKIIYQELICKKIKNRTSTLFQIRIIQKARNKPLDLHTEALKKFSNDNDIGVGFDVYY